MTNFYNEIYKLKTLVRRGWTFRDAHNGRVESDAEHTFSMALVALEIMHKEKLQLDEAKVLKMIMFHELGEIDAGDITPFDNITKTEKYEKELACIQRISNECDMPEILELWKEFEENKTPEARFVKVIDKLDTVMQAKKYSSLQNETVLFDEMYEAYKEVINDYIKYV